MERGTLGQETRGVPVWFVEEHRNTKSEWNTALLPLWWIGKSWHDSTNRGSLESIECVGCSIQ